MPELPEVEHGRSIAERTLTGRRIVSVAAADDRIVYTGISPRRFAAAVRGCTVIAVHRRGKHLWLRLDQPPHPVLHFGMTGAFSVYRQRHDRPKFWKLELTTDAGDRLCMTNKRRLGRIGLKRDPPNEPPISRLGFDPLLDLPRSAVIATRLQRRRAPIKAVLLDQAVFAGVGNWIADEVLYQAAIAPHRPACELDKGEVAKLRTRLRTVIRKAVEVDADKSRFPTNWLFHHRWRRQKGATTRRGEPIVHETIAGRTAAWVPTVQQ